MLTPEIKQQISQICSIALSFIRKVMAQLSHRFSNIIVFFKNKITSWWQVFFIFIFILIFLYYPLGGYLVHNIEKKPYKSQNTDGRLASFDVVSYLINREVHHKIWTPNLPFMFPSYFLDNMPSFQTGIINACAQTVLAFEGVTFSKATDSARHNLLEGINLLQYPEQIWMFSPHNKLSPAPSSGTQYKKGRKKINNFNAEISGGLTEIERSHENLSLILHIIKKDLEKTTRKTDEHIRENAGSFIDFQKDNIFFYEQGKLYAYSIILNGLGTDFKNILIKNDLYQPWTIMIKSMEKASELSPSIVRNASIDSSVAPNHLVSINYLALRSLYTLNHIINKLDHIRGSSHDY